ncbi:MAG: HAMP domain-containing sensor histidine kinase [Bacteroidota bacterium]
MKLVDKFTLCFLLIFFIVTPISIYSTHYSIKQRIDNVEIERLSAVNNEVALQLKSGISPDKYSQGRPISISTFAGNLPNEKTLTEKQNYDQGDCRITVSSFYNIKGLNYKVSSYNYVTQSGQILRGMLPVALIKSLLMIVAVLIAARMLSRNILSPFNQSLAQMQKFNLRKKKPLVLAESNTKEFKELNLLLKKMTDMAITEYGLVKEFSENASHELQTPLSVLRSKLELLADTDIQGDQAILIGEMQHAIEKMARINHSLLLLTKLENQEYEATEHISFAGHIKSILGFYEDRIQMKALTLTTHIGDDISLKIHPALADLLFDNLLGNAIRHNVKNGIINIKANHEAFVIENTGAAPVIPTEELFERFKKSDQCGESIGLGLAIVKQICELNKFNVRYTYRDGMHSLRIDFNGMAVANSAALIAQV